MKGLSHREQPAARIAGAGGPTANRSTQRLNDREKRAKILI
jgi:hypothetical protein